MCVSPWHGIAYCIGVECIFDGSALRTASSLLFTYISHMGGWEHKKCVRAVQSLELLDFLHYFRM